VGSVLSGSAIRNPQSAMVTGGGVFQDLKVIDWHAHFPIRGDVSQGGQRTREPRPGAGGEEREAFRRQQLQRYQAQWRLAFDFPEPETEARSSDRKSTRLNSR